MRKYWWTVWIKVAVLAVVLFMGYRYVSGWVVDLFSPYLIEESDTSGVTSEDDMPSEETALEQESTEEETEGNLVMDIFGKIEDTFDVKIDFENMIFDYANEYALEMKEQSEQERNPVSEPLGE